MPIKTASRRRALIIAVALGNLIFWLIPSNVPALVAKEQQVLCGRYSRVQFAWMLGVALLSAVIIYLGSASDSRRMRQRVFALCAMIIGIVPIAVIADIALRLRTEYPYQSDPVVYHRPPNKRYHQIYRDEPVARRSYPVAQPGFGSVDCTLTYDAAGYRNKDLPASCDVVAVGDSFTEGSRVSDDQPWPVLLGKQTARRVYNLGISGYGPPEYLAALKAYGLPRKPKCVICMLYEGNDFHTAETEAKAGVSTRQFIRTSPLLLATNDAMVQAFGSIGADWHVRGLDDLCWMPVAFPSGQKPRYYAFPPKQLTELNISPREFAISEEWFAVKSELRSMQEICLAAGAKLFIAYAPNKAHVIFPLAAASIASDRLESFISMQKKVRAEPDFKEELCRNLESREKVIEDYCREKSIAFISTTLALRKSANEGEQPYYTYDQHWSPEGHATAARRIAAGLAEAGI